MSSPAAGVALAIAAFISRVCFRRPNPTPPNPQQYDNPLIGSILIYGPSIREYVLFALAIPHILLAVIYDPPHALCPNPSHVNPRYITLSPHVITWVVLIVVLGLIRIVAFNQLGRNFTFELARPAKLVRTGLYKYVQHPSYPPDLILSLGNYALFGAIDGWFACYLPQDLVNSLEWTNGVIFLTLIAVAFYGLRLRILDEEAMLKESFGQEWEEWHAKTARFIPGIW